MTATPTTVVAGRGPAIVTFAAFANVDGCVFCCSPDCARTPTPTPVFDGEGRRVFPLRSGQFLLVLEGIAGASFLPPGSSLGPSAPDGRPDLQILASRNLGNGSVEVCDVGSAASGGGGIPGVDPPLFGPQPAISDALLDFACRFDPGVSHVNPCTTLDASRDPRVVFPGAQTQFCSAVASTFTFPVGDTVLTARLRDVAGNLGPTAQMVIRVATPTPRR